MLKKLLLLLVLLFFVTSHAQELVYHSNGNIRDAQNNKLTPDQVRVLLAENQSALAQYNAGRNKKTIGNVLLVGGLGLLATDLVYELYGPQKRNDDDTQQKRYPSAMTFIGIGALVISIPVKIGYSRKIKSAVEGYNANAGATGYHKVNFITDGKGVGFRLTFN